MNIPILIARGDSIAETWEKSLIMLNAFGIEIPTQYDKEGDPPSKDCTMVMEVCKPLSEPMIHRELPGSLENLQEYTMEICDGIKDHWIRNPNNPDDKRWEYTYHDRLFNYSYIIEYDHYEHGIYKQNQIENICQQLSQVPYTRRAQAITWKVWEDNTCYDPACLQSIWCRIINDTLNMNVRFRSRDAFKAALMNIYGLVRLQEKMAQRISELSQREIKVGRYCDLSDSYHLYGSYFNEFNNRFLPSLEKRTFEQRTFKYEDIKDIMEEARPKILEKIKQYDKSHEQNQ